MPFPRRNHSRRAALWIYFISDRGDGTAVWKAPAGGGPPVRVTRKGDSPVFESFEGKFVYYGGPDERIWKVPAAGGEETPVLEKSRRALWTLSESGIYILDPDAKGGPEIDFFRFTTGERMQILKLPGEPDEHVWGSGTLAVSPDQRWILYERRDRHEADIMLVENFR